MTSSAPFPAQITADPTYQYGVGQSNSTGSEGMWDDDVDVQFGVDEYYGVADFAGGDYTFIDQGLINGVPNGGTFRYRWWDVSLGLWSNESIETFTVLGNPVITSVSGDDIVESIEASVAIVGTDLASAANYRIQDAEGNWSTPLPVQSASDTLVVVDMLNMRASGFKFGAGLMELS